MIKSKKEKLESEKLKNDMDEVQIPVTDSDDNENSTDEKVQSLENQLAELKDQFLRKSAEFENYKRRTDADRASLYSYANEKLISELLPVLDDFERALESYDQKHDAETFKKGIELVYEKFKKVLQKQGLKEIDSSGKPFDVNLHDAVMQQQSEAEPNTVLNTVEKGYNLNDKVLRHAKVVVSTKPAK
jgi:molecular chaperone GrpE